MNTQEASVDAGTAERREAEGREARERKLESARLNAEKRASLKLVSWNVNRIAPRASNVDVVFAQEEVDLLFVCETKQRRWAGVIIEHIEFKCSITSMPAHVQTSGKRQSSSMGIAFLSKRPGLVSRESDYQKSRNKW